MASQPKRLNQLIAIEKTRKGELEKLVTGIYHWFQRQGAFDGFTKRYEPLVEGGQQYAPERANVQHTVPNLLQTIRESMTNLLDLTASKDATNGVSRAPIVVNGTTLIENVPGTTLLSLDKQLTDLRTIVGKLPVLDAAIEWHWDEASSLYRSAEQWTLRQEKHKEPLVLYPHTDKHPAQVKEIEVTKNVGTWYTVKFSGAVPVSERDKVLARIDELRVAVKIAEEEANLVSTVETPIGDKIFEWILR